MKTSDKTHTEHRKEIELLRARLVELESLLLDHNLSMSAPEGRESLYRHLVELSPDAIALLQGEVHKFVNPAFTEIFGYTQADVEQGLPVMALVHEHDKEAVLLRYEKLQVGELDSAMYCIDLVAKDGSLIPCEASAKIISYLGAPASLVVLRNVTDRKQSEEALRESEERFRSSFEASEVAMSIVDLRGNLISVNQAGCRLFGYSREEMLAQSMAILTHPEDREESVGRFRRCLEDHKPYSFKKRYLRSDGQIIIGIISVSPVTDSKGELLHVVAHLQDLTEGERAQQEKAQLEAQLRHTQKMETLGTLAGGVAHDFNNILAALFGYLDLSLAEMEPGDPVYPHIKKSKEGVERAAGLVEQILVFSGKTKEERVPINIPAIVCETLDFLRATLPTTIEIHQNIDTNCAAVVANKTQIQQLVMNLSANASQAMEKNGGQLEFHLKEDILDASNKLNLPEGRYVKLDVKDSGCGMDAETVRSIFDPFFTTKAPGKGTGLGLSMVFGIVKSCDGDITVESKPGEGSVFSVYLPVTEKQLQSIPLESETLSRGTERILLVDDEESIVYVHKQLLERLGYEVSICTSGFEAIKIFSDNPDYFDLVISDQTMPETTGLELAKKLKQIRPGLQIILATGFSEQATSENLKNAGISRCVTKPLSFKELSQAVRGVLDAAAAAVKK